MIKLQDFARQQGVTDRAIQKHLKTYAEELDGLFQRKGPNGTWLTEEACEILRSKMKQAPAAVFEPDPRVGQLQQELMEARADFRDLLRQMEQKDKTMTLLVEQNEQYRLQVASVARLEADNDAAREKAAEADKRAQEAQKELVDAQKAYETDLAKKDKQIKALEQYATELQQYHAAEAAYQKRWFKKKKDKPVPPVPPDILEA